MCYVSYQIDRHLAAEDRAAAHQDWLGMRAQNDSYELYRADAMEAVDGALSANDNEVLEDFGIDGYALLSAEGKEAVDDKAQEIGSKEWFKRYE